MTDVSLVNCTCEAFDYCAADIVKGMDGCTIECMIFKSKAAGFGAAEERMACPNKESISPIDQSCPL